MNFVKLRSKRQELFLYSIGKVFRSILSYPCDGCNHGSISAYLSAFCPKVFILSELQLVTRSASGGRSLHLCSPEVIKLRLMICMLDVKLIWLKLAAATRSKTISDVFLKICFEHWKDIPACFFSTSDFRVLSPCKSIKCYQQNK